MFRIRRLALALILGLVFGPLAPLPASAAPPPPARVLQAVLAHAGTAFTTEAVKAPGRFDLAGLAYDGPAADVELRASSDGQRWTPWYEAGDSTEDGPDVQSPEHHADHTTLPVWTDSASYVQYRVRSTGGPVRNLRLQAVDVQGHGESLTDKIIRHVKGIGMSAPAPAHAMADQPPIVTRAQWGADESIRKGSPSYGTVKMAFVHHTVNANDYSPSQAPALIRGIYAYHVKSNGWDDIGYNFLVDRYGTVYEGRAGGIDRPVIGAHTQGFNSVSFGASLLGTFTAADPPAAMLSSLQRLLAWRLDVAHVDPLAKVTVRSAGSNKWPAGATPTFNAISGHRDAGQTECPGDRAYADLGAIRSAVARTGFPKIFDPGSAPKGSQVAFGARATEPLTWSVVISQPQLGDIRHLSTPASPTLGLTWDGTDDNGRPMPSGSYVATISGKGGSGNARPATVPAPLDAPANDKPVTRLAGADRFATAAAASKTVAPAPTANVVLASGETAHLVDSLVAAPLAKVKSAPLLLTNAASLPAATTGELDRLHPSDAWLVGGPVAISDAVATALQQRGITVHRLAGDDAPATAAAVAGALGGKRSSALVVALDRTHLVDGLAASGAAAGLGRPVLLVSHDEVPPATASALQSLGVTEVWAVGGPTAIGDGVVSALRARRVAGGDRWATAVAVGDSAAGAGLTADTFVVASGETTNLVDALAGGAFAVPVLLSMRAALPTPTWNGLYADRAGIRGAYVLGGPGAIGDGAMADVRRAISAP